MENSGIDPGTFILRRKYIWFLVVFLKSGELAQMVERPLRMREVPGSIPGFSNFCFDDINRSYFGGRISGPVHICAFLTYILHVEIILILKDQAESHCR